MRRITIMSGPIRFMILAIVIGIKISVMLFCKKVVTCSIDSYLIWRVIFPESSFLSCARQRAVYWIALFKNWGIKVRWREFY
jgi:hypothetical protein